MAEGVIDWSGSTEPRCGTHDIYHALFSSGGPIYDSKDGIFLGVQQGNISQECVKPQEHDGQVLFPACPMASGKYVATPPEWIQKMLKNGRWMDAEAGRSSYCAQMKPKRKKGLGIAPGLSPGWDWC